MSPVQEQANAFSSYNSSAILDEMRLLGEVQSNPGARKALNSELWHACAGPLVSLPQPGSLVYYFPQGHSEQVSASTRKISNSHIPNYPTLPSQLLCQVHNVTLHADRDTDEIYAQMTLQPVNSEGDVFPIPNLGHAISKQPNEFFCKNLTASDTSTHGGFSVPRRAAEKLFPQLDYTMQPPNQELIVRDLHDNVWTFRHIYRGQPKRHLLTTGWSLFVGTKRLKAGDSVLFIRGERSQLLVGVRRANRQQTALPSSVLSTDSMHIGVLAAAAHAAASRSPFTIYYNPRACPSEFIIPMTKYHKAVYAQVSVGMRFGMMFETEESTKRRYMGTIVGINDFDPLRWPNSKWRNVQVEWDEQGYGERPDRVSLWEIETPESLFVFPAPSLKRQCLPGFMVPGTEIGFGHVKPLSQALEFGTSIMHPTVSDVGSDHLMKLLLTPQNPSPDNQFRYHQSIYASILQKIGGNVSLPTFSAGRSSMMQQEAIATKNILSEAQTSRCSMELQVVDVDNATDEALVLKQEDQLVAETLSQKNSPEQSKNHKNENLGSNCDTLSSHEAVKESDIASEVRTEKVVISEKHIETSVGLGGSLNDENLVSPIFMDQEQQLKGVAPPHSLDKDNLVNLSKPQSYHSPQRSCYQSFTGPSTEPGFLSSSNLSDPLLLLASDVAASPSADISSIVNPVKLNPFETFQFSSFSPSYVQEFFSGQEMSPVHESDLHKITKSCGMRDLSDKSINQSDTYSSQQFEASNENMISSSCVSSTILEGFSNPKNSSFCVHSEDLFSSLADSQLRSLQDIPEGSGGNSSGSMEINECNFLNKSSMKQIAQQRLRTYTKVQKLGSVGRSIDVTRFKDYHELKSAIACMFGLQQQFDDSGSSEWKLVYVDYENDVLLVGDDPWEEFVKCVKCIRILSPSEVQQMSEEGLQLMNSYLPPSL